MKKTTKRIVAWMLTVALMLNMGGTVVYAEGDGTLGDIPVTDTGPPEDPVPVQDEAQPPPDVQEIPADIPVDPEPPEPTETVETPPEPAPEETVQGPEQVPGPPPAPPVEPDPKPDVTPAPTPAEPQIMPVPSPEPTDEPALNKELASNSELPEEQDAEETGEAKDEKRAGHEIYALTVRHVLSAEIGDWGVLQFCEESNIELDAEAVDAGVDVSRYVIEREGIRTTEVPGPLHAENFGEDGKGAVTVAYEIAPGYKATYNKPFMPISVYKGTFDDVTITPVGEYKVTVSFLFEGGAVAMPSVTVYVGDGEPFEYAFEKIPGYEVEIDPASFVYDGGTLRGEVTADTEISVTFKARMAEYTVQFQTEDGTTLRDPVQRTGIVGNMTDLTGLDLGIEHYVPRDVAAQTIAEDGSTVVTVVYDPEEYLLKYDTMGGSYVPSKTVKYKEDVEVYSGEPGYDCPQEEHTHTPASGAASRWNVGQQSGCYTCVQSGGMFSRTYSWELSCGKAEHTHSPACQKASTVTPAPTREGYTFAGWFADEECTVPADTTVHGMSGDVTVYAKWNAQNVTYTVVYMKEVWDGSEAEGPYTYYGQSTKTAAAGATVTAADDISIDYYTFSHLGPEASVAPDGSTVVYAYYDLTVYTFIFNLNDSRNATGAITMNGREYHGSEYRIEARLGQDISALWPTTENTSRSNGQILDKWGSSYKTKRFEVTADMLDEADGSHSITYTASWMNSGSTRKTVEYWLQDADGNGYTLSEAYSQEFFSDSGLSAKDIYGFTQHSGTPAGYKGNESTGSGWNSTVTTYRFYYDRETRDIIYYSGAEKVREMTGLRFGADISAARYNFTPDRPDGLDAEAVFAGWFDNAELKGDAYTFSTMPANDLVLYAKWTMPEKSITVHVNNGNEDTTYTVQKGDKLDRLGTPTRDGYVFAGWFTDADCTQAFDVNMPIEDDIDIYAKWEERKTWTYSVTHVFVKDGVEMYRETVTGSAAKATESVTVRADSGLYEDGKDYIPDAYSLVLERDGSREATITYTWFEASVLPYKVEYRYGDEVIASSGDLTSEAVSLRVTADQNIVNDLLRQGYSIDQQYRDVTLTTDAAKNVVVFTLSLREFTISYVLGGGTNAPENPARYTSKDDFYIEAPSRPGYDFIGWELGGDMSAEGAGHDKLRPHVEAGTAGDLVFIAAWKESQVTIRYAADPADGGTVSRSEESVQVLSGTAQGSTASPSTGYHFVNWTRQDTGDAVSEQLTFVPEKDTAGYLAMTYIAHFAKNTHTVTYSVTGDVPDGYSPPAKETHEFGDIYTVPAAPDADMYTERDANGNILKRYTFSGWDVPAGNHTMQDADVTVSGTWTLAIDRDEDSYLRTLTYRFDGDVPAGAENALPESETYRQGDFFVAADLPDTVEDDFDVRDEYGNLITDYTFTGWSPAGGKVGEEDVTVTGTWTKTEYPESRYEHVLRYLWEHAPDGVTLPKGGVYREGQEYTVDTKYTNKSTVEERDIYGNLLKQYTFSGWDHSDGKMGKTDINVAGSWSLTESHTEDEYKHTVTYSVSGDVPDGYSVPEQKAYITGQEYTVADTPDANAYTVKDTYGNVLKQYSFSGWNVSGTHKMGDTDITIHGEWTVTEIDAETYRHTVTYSTDGDVPDGYTPPEQKTYTTGETYTVADKPDTDAYTVRDTYGNLLTQYSFSGWSLEGTQKMGDTDVGISGTWSKTEYDPAIYDHTVTYSWDDAPDDAVLPQGGTYKTGQTYSIDTGYTKDSTVEERDGNGNLLKRYSFSGWDAEDGVMGDADIAVHGTWTVTEEHSAEEYLHTVRYSVDGDVPDSYTVPEPKTYTTGDTYLVEPAPDAAKYLVADGNGNVLKRYAFEGWSVPTGTHTMGDADVVVHGTWTVTEIDPETYKHTVSYRFTGDVPDTAAAALPAPEVLTKGDGFSAAAMPDTVQDAYDVYDSFGNLLTDYTFTGWAPAQGTVGDEDIVITGTWTAVTHPREEYEHLVIVRYLDEDGNELMDSEQVTVTTGDTYDVESLVYQTISKADGEYTQSSVTGPVTGEMGKEDVIVTVVYAKQAAPVVPGPVTPEPPDTPDPDPDTPDAPDAEDTDPDTPEPEPQPTTPVPPYTPPGNGPTGTGTPGGGTVDPVPAPPANIDSITIEDDETPLGVSPEPGYKLEESVGIEENETPLAKEWDYQNCCILHLLIVLLALLVELYFTHTRKKGQEYLFELKRMIAEVQADMDSEANLALA